MSNSKKIILIDLDHTLYDVDNEVLYPDALDFIGYAKKYGEIYLFTEGDLKFQEEKIKRLQLDELFGDNILLHKEYEKMDGVKNKFSSKDVILIDDRADVIDKAIVLGWRTIKVKRGRHQSEECNLLPDYAVNSLRAIIGKKYLV